MEKPQEIIEDSPNPPGKFTTWFRSFARWVLILLITFGLGILLATLVWHLPLQQKEQETARQLENAEEQITTLTGQVSELTAANDVQKVELQAANLQRHLLNVLAEVRAARLALELKNTDGADIAMQKADQALSRLALIIDVDHAENVANMQVDIRQIMINLSADPDAASALLEQLDTNLVSLGNALFPTP